MHWPRPARGSPMLTVPAPFVRRRVPASLTGKWPARLGLTDFLGGSTKGRLLPAPYCQGIAEGRPHDRPSPARWRVPDFPRRQVASRAGGDIAGASWLRRERCIRTSESAWLPPPFSRPPAGAQVAHASGVTAEWDGCNGWLGGRSGSMGPFPTNRRRPVAEETEIRPGKALTFNPVSFFEFGRQKGSERSADPRVKAQPGLGARGDPPREHELFLRVR